MTTEKDSNLMSTLLVSTVYPEEGRESTFVEVATIRSPYSFTFEDGMSTRYEPIFTIQSLNVDAHYIITTFSPL